MYLAVCDDELSQINHIVTLLEAYRREKLPSLRWITFQTGFSLLAAIEQGRSFDGVLLDIYMTDMNGMEAARSIRTMNNNINILFLTSSPDFAVESYQVDACDYLLKPLRKDKLFRSLDKLVSRLKTAEEQGIVVKNTEGGIIKIIWNKLMYLEAMGHYGVLYHADGSTTRTVLSFSSLLKQLSMRNNFIQIHRSYAVNLHYIHRIEKDKVILLNGTALPLPRSRYQEVSNYFQNILFGEERLS